MKQPSKNCLRWVALLCFMAILIGCKSLKERNQVSLGEVYDDLAHLPDTERNPVIVIPGILGSRLVDKETDEVVWGEMGPAGVSPLKTHSLTELALPMQQGVPLHQLHDQVTHCLLYTSPSPRDQRGSRMPSSA